MHQAGYPRFIRSHVTDQALQEADSSSLRFVCRKVIGRGGGRLGSIPVKGSKTGSMKKLMLANPLESSGGSRVVQSRPRMGQGSCSSLPTMSLPRDTPYWALEDAGCLGMGAWSWVRQPSSAEGRLWQHHLHPRVLLWRGCSKSSATWNNTLWESYQKLEFRDKQITGWKAWGLLPHLCT